MDFKEVLKNGAFSLHLESNTKTGVIEEMIDLLVSSGKLKPSERDAALRAVVEREQRMSTGMQDGVAIPHGKTPAVEGLVNVFALKKEGMDFGAMDKKPSRIFVMTVSSTLQAGPHIEYLSKISKPLGRESVRAKLMEATSVDEIVEILTAE
jgi:PTS system nitrogen regulatory IIA component